MSGKTAKTTVDDKTTENDNNLTDAEAEAIFSESAGATDEGTAPEEKAPDTADDDKGGDEAGSTDDKTGSTTPASGNTDKGSGTPDDKKTIADGGKRPSGDESRKVPYESLEKALGDTKRWGTDLATRNSALSTENSNLKKELEGLKKAKPADKSATTDQEMTEGEKQYLQDFPEARTIIEREARRLAGQIVDERMAGVDVADINQTVSDMREAILQGNFERAVIGGFVDKSGAWVDGHPDAMKIFASPEYRQWYADESKVNPTLGNISHPKDAIDLIARYKTVKARSAAERHDAETGDQTRDVKKIVSGAPEQGTNVEQKGRKRDEDKSPEEIFKEYSK